MSAYAPTVNDNVRRYPAKIRGMQLPGGTPAGSACQPLLRPACAQANCDAVLLPGRLDASERDPAMSDTVLERKAVAIPVTRDLRRRLGRPRRRDAARSAVAQHRTAKGACRRGILTG